MASIFKLTADQARLMTMVESGDISKEDAADTFEGMEGQLNKKINDYCLVRRKMNGDLDVISAEIERLTKIKSEKENQIKNLTQSLCVALDSVGESKFDTGLFKGHFRKGRTSLKVINPSVIPDEYITTSITEKIDKTQLKKDIESGAIECDGAELTIGATTLIIK